MSLDWQNAIVILAIVAAGGYLARLAWQTVARRQAAACGGGCGSCPATQEEGARQVISLDQLAASSKTKNPADSAASV